MPLLPGQRRSSRSSTTRSRPRRTVGYPVMLKATAGGGGIGMRVCDDAAQLADVVRRRAPPGRRGVRRRAGLPRALARRRPPRRGADLRRRIGPRRHARRARLLGAAPQPEGDRGDARARPPGRAPRAHARTRPRGSPRRSSYRSAGTVEFVVDVATDTVAFLEVNTRLQVEHTVTEAVTGVDLVEWMVRIAAGDARVLDAERRAARPRDRGAGLRREPVARPRAQRRARSPRSSFPDDVRVDTWVEAGTEVTANYDPLLAKVVAHGDDAGRRARPARAPRSTRRASTASRPTSTACARSSRRPTSPTRASRRRCSPASHRRAARSRCSRAARRPPCRTTPAGSGTGPSACRRAGRWTTSRSGSATGSSATPTARPGSSCTAPGPRLLFHTAATVCLTGAPSAADVDGARCRCGKPVDDRGRRGRDHRRDRSAGRARVPARARRHRRRAGARQRVDVHARRLRRPRGPRAAHRRRAAPRRRRRPRRERAAPRVERPDDHRRLGDRGARRAARRRRVPHRRRHRHASTPTEWQVHHNSARTGVRLIGPSPAVGARRRRRGRPAPVEHPRHRVLRRHDRLHRRHADHPRPRRPEPRRLRVPGGRRGRRPVEARPAPPRATRALRARRATTTPTRAARPRRRRHARPALDAAGTAATPAAACSTRGRRTPAGRRCSGGAAATTTCSSSTGRWCSTSSCASACTRCSSGSRSRRRAASSTSRPGIRSLQVHFDPTSSTTQRHARGCSRPPRASCPPTDATTVAEPHRAPAAVLGRPGNPRGDRPVHVDGARRRAVVPEEHRVHPAHQRPRLRRRRASASCSTRRTSCSASATSTSARRSRRRSIRATGWSPRSTTRRAPGRRRTRSASAARISASTAWRARAATSSSAAPCRCGTASAAPTDFTEPWLLRFFDQLRFFEVGADELLDWRRDVLTGPRRAPGRALDVAARRAPRLRAARTQPRSARSAPASRTRSTPNAARWAEAELSQPASVALPA